MLCRYPFTPGALPRDTGNDKMLHVLIGEYTANSLLYSLWKNGTFSGAVSESSVSFSFPVLQSLLKRHHVNEDGLMHALLIAEFQAKPLLR